MNKHYTSGMAMRESRPRSKRLQGLGVGASKTSPGTLSWALAVKSALFDSMFELVGTGTTEDPYLIHAKHPLYSDGEITASGVGSGETPGPATTLGALLNVSADADIAPASDKLLVRLAGSTHWTLTDLASISGTVTGVRMNGTVRNPGTDKIVDLGTVITSLAGYATEAYVSENYLASSQKGVANGLAELDANGKVPSAQLPSYVDDVLEYASMSAFPATGESGKIYVALDTNLTYRWGGSAYVPISQSLALGETSSTAYRGDRGKTAYDHSQITSGNPHGTTFAQLGGSLAFDKLPDIYVAGTKAKSSASDDVLSRVTRISFTAASSASESVDLEVVTINGQRFLHTSLPFFSDSEITAGGVGSGGGSSTITLATLLDVKHSSGNVVQRLSGGDVQTGDLFLKGDSTHWYALAKGANGQILKMVNGIPSWGDAPATGVTSISVNSGAAQTGAVALTIPTKTSDLTNDSGFITSSALNGYATQTWVSQQGYASASSLNSYLPLTGGTMTGTLYYKALNGNNTGHLDGHFYHNLLNGTVYEHFYPRSYEYDTPSTAPSTSVNWRVWDGVNHKIVTLYFDRGGLTFKGNTIYHSGNLTKSTLGLGNVENTALSTWAGSANITTLGTVAAGVWQGTAIADSYIASAATWNALKTLFESMFERHGSGTDADPYTIKAKYALWSPFEITAGGIGSGGGGGTGALYNCADVTSFNDSKVGRSTTEGAQVGDLLAYDGTHWHAVVAPATGVTAIKVNGGSAQTGEVSLTIPSAVTESTVSGWGFTKNAGTVTQVKVGSTAYDPVSGVVSLPAYPTTLPASDVYAWAKASSKPSYSYSEISGRPTKLSDLTDDVVSGHYQPLATAINTGNIGSQSVAYASNAGSISGTLPCISASIENDEVQFVKDTEWNYWGDGRGWRIEKTLRFRWYNTYNYFGLIRAGGTGSAGFGFAYQETASSAFTPIAQLNPSGNLYLRGNAYCNGNIVYHSGNLTAAAIGAESTSHAAATYLPLSGGTINGNLQVEGTVKAAYLNIHPENRGAIIPYIFNDIAFIDKRGGSISLYSTTSTDFTSLVLTGHGEIAVWAAISNVVDGTSSYLNGPASAVAGKTVIFDFDFGQIREYYLSKAYIDFGTEGWSPDEMPSFFFLLEGESAYRPADRYEDNVDRSIRIAQFRDNDGIGVKAMRIVMKYNSERTHQFRIAGIGIIDYDSPLLSTTFMSRGNDDPVWRSISPSENNRYDLGKAGYKWSNVYTTALNADNIYASGNVGIGTTSPSEKLHVIGNITATGEITAGSASDARFKDAIAPLRKAITVLKALRPVEFDWNGYYSSLGGRKDGHDVGFVAQEVKPLIPSAVSYIFGDHLRLDYTKITPYLVSGWQSHEQRIAALERENAELKRQLSTINS